MFINERIQACRRKAIECQRCALAAPDHDIRQMYLDLAKQWKELAEYAVAIERHRRKKLIPRPIEE